MAESTGEKSHDPTPQRRQQAREQGQVARSHEVGSALVLCGAVMALLWLGRPVVDLLGNTMVRQLGGEAWLSADIPFVMRTWNGVLSSLAVVLLPIMGLMMLLAVFGSVVQVGWLFLPARALPDASRLDPVKGLSRLFSLANVARLGFSLLKLVVVACVAWYSLLADQERILNCNQLALPELAVFVSQVLIWTALKIGLALMALALVDYGYERWRHERDLRMTAQEIRAELRDSQGDPVVKSRRRALRGQLGKSSLSAGMAEASLVITDAQGLAIAVSYDADSMAAPVVVAKGTGAEAQRIRLLAAARHIPSAERQALARALHASIEINRPIPASYYQGIAELLSTVDARPAATSALATASRSLS